MIKTKDIVLERLTFNIKNVAIVKKLIDQDISGKCFLNKDSEGNVLSNQKLAIMYLKYSKVFAIKYNEDYIGLLSLFDSNEVSFYIIPSMQNKNIGSISSKKFLELLEEKYKIASIIAETSIDNISCQKLLSNLDFIETNSLRELEINGTKKIVRKYIRNK